MKRLFVGVDLDEPVRASVAEISEGLSRRLGNQGRFGRITWVRPEHLHLTLRFLGEVEESAAAAIQTALAPPLTSPTFQLAFEGLGIFPPAGRPRVLWLAVTEGAADLRRVHDEIERRLETAGILSDARPFRAHLTLARFREPEMRPDAAGLSAAAAHTGSCRVDRVRLYESRLARRGPIHTAIGETKLGPS